MSIRFVQTILLLTVCGSVLPACGDDDAASADAGSRPDRTMIVRDPWTREVVASGAVGVSNSITIAGGTTPMIAYYAVNSMNGGPCTEVMFTPTPDRLRYRLFYAERGASGTWTTETISDVLALTNPPGLSIRADASGAPLVAALTGMASARYCGANDLAIYNRGAGGVWTPQVAVATSGEAATGMPASDFGDVVGYWPALAIDGSGNLGIAYRDVHSGSIQADDLRRADLELAIRTGGAWRAIPVDPGMGAGEFNAMVYDRMDRPVIVYFNGVGATASGLWVTRSDDGGMTWDRVRLLTTNTADGPDVTIDSMGRIVVMYYDAPRKSAYVATLTNDAMFDSLASGWTVEAVGDSRFDEGTYGTIAVDPSGNLALAYYRCSRTTTSTCNPTEDALVFAYQQAGSWNVETVDEGTGAGACGTYTALAFDSMGRANIAYTCETDGAQAEVKFAVREAL